MLFQVKEITFMVFLQGRRRFIRWTPVGNKSQKVRFYIMIVRVLLQYLHCLPLKLSSVCVFIKNTVYTQYFDVTSD